MTTSRGCPCSSIQRLGHLLADPRYLDATERCLKAAWSHIQEAPHAHASLLEALDEHLQPPQMVILRGAENVLADWQAQLVKHHRPGRLVFGIPSHAKDLPEALANYRPGETVTAWVCTETECSPPMTEWRVLEKALA